MASIAGGLPAGVALATFAPEALAAGAARLGLGTVARVLEGTAGEVLPSAVPGAARAAMPGLAGAAVRAGSAGVNNAIGAGAVGAATAGDEPWYDRALHTAEWGGPIGAFGRALWNNGAGRFINAPLDPVVAATMDTPEARRLNITGPQIVQNSAVARAGAAGHDIALAQHQTEQFTREAAQLAGLPPGTDRLRTGFDAAGQPLEIETLKRQAGRLINDGVARLPYVGDHEFLNDLTALRARLAPNALDAAGRRHAERLWGYV